MNKLIQFIWSCTLLLLVASCGGGGGDAGGTNTSSKSATGSVALLLTDGPTDEVDEVNLRIIKAELMSDDGRVTIFEGDETVNLLNYRHDAKIFAMDDGVPVGTYSKIRLTLESIELVWRDESGLIIETAFPKLPGSGKLDLNPRSSFDVNTGETLLLQIDIDAKKAIHIVKKGSKDEYNFRPVVFVDVLTTDFSGKLVRVFGNIREIDDENYENQHITLCDIDLFAQPIIAEADGRCVEIYTDSDTGFFDEDGSPIELNKVAVDESIVVVGNLMIGYSEGTDIEILAIVVERGAAGTYKPLQGKALSSVDMDDQFRLAIESSSAELAETTDVTVQLQATTAIIDPTGKRLGPDLIDEGVPVSVDAVPAASADDDNLLLAALVIVDLNDAGIDPIRGVISIIPDGVCGFSVLPSDGSSDLSIRTSEDTLILKITSSTSSELVKVGDLTDAVTVDLYGSIATDGCFDAGAVIVFE